MGNLKQIKDFAEGAIIVHVENDINAFFDFSCHQRDVAAWDFTFNGTLKKKAKFDAEWLDGIAQVEAEWDDATLDDEIRFVLFNVDAVVTEYTEDGEETKHRLHFDRIPT